MDSGFNMLGQFQGDSSLGQGFFQGAQLQDSLESFNFENSPFGKAMPDEQRETFQGTQEF